MYVGGPVFVSVFKTSRTAWAQCLGAKSLAINTTLAVDTMCRSQAASIMSTFHIEIMKMITTIPGLHIFEMLPLAYVRCYQQFAYLRRIPWSTARGWWSHVNTLLHIPRRDFSCWRTQKTELIDRFRFFMVFYTPNYTAFVFQISYDSHHRLRSYCWETARSSIRPSFPCTL